jgi:phytanoyl-CoA hydroxylase
MYLEDSSTIGEAMEADFNRRAEFFTPEERINGFNQNMAKDGQLSHNAAQLTEEIESGMWGGEKLRKKRKWLVGDYEAGDVIFHNPYMVHGAVKNDDPEGRIRLSTDLRFYEEGSKLDERWMRSVWTPGDGL